MRRGAAQKRLPAFGKELLDLRRRGLVWAPAQCYVCLDTWDYARGRTRVVVSPDLDPAGLDFSFLAGIDAWLIWLPKKTTLARRDDAIRALLRAGPERLLMWAINDTPELVWLKSKQVGVEWSEYA